MMTDLEKQQFAAAQLLQRVAALMVEVVNTQVEAEAQKRRADALQERLDKLAPKDAAAAE